MSKTFERELHSQKRKETLDHGELCLVWHCCSQSNKLPTFLSDHLDELTGRARENPSTQKRPCILHAS